MNNNIVHVTSELEDLIPNFIKNRFNDIEALKVAVANMDYASISFLGHSIKGTAGGYGFDYMSSIALKLELAAKENNMVEIKSLAKNLEDHLNQIEIILVEE
ncbi:Hpt domain-containing protein [Clostridium cellulovorans]|uniref:Hpt domain protein n=1 Tax=Clostridium cellulovorans (strain ATCC 35296 / DSM 3052 / OCM 3 / 743B) TaxID=573061 RepID=D9STB5_CLOC7|nr:Hpt domain-containing protein [Clostridium cellulovorans]ADL50731.1 Hpt domain protein [Clostridium cellulovorans 743B]